MQVLRCEDVNVFKCYFTQVLRCAGASVCRCKCLLMQALVNACTKRLSLFI